MNMRLALRGQCVLRRPARFVNGRLRVLYQKTEDMLWEITSARPAGKPRR